MKYTYIIYKASLLFDMFFVQLVSLKATFTTGVRDIWII